MQGAEAVLDPITGPVQLHRFPITAVIVDLTLGFTVPTIKACFDRRPPGTRRPPVIAHASFNTAFIAR